MTAFANFSDDIKRRNPQLHQEYTERAKSVKPDNVPTKPTKRGITQGNARITATYAKSKRTQLVEGGICESHMMDNKEISCE